MKKSSYTFKFTLYTCFIEYNDGSLSHNAKILNLIETTAVSIK